MPRYNTWEMSLPGGQSRDSFWYQNIFINKTLVVAQCWLKYNKTCCCFCKRQARRRLFNAGVISLTCVSCGVFSREMKMEKRPCSGIARVTPSSHMGPLAHPSSPAGKTSCCLDKTLSGKNITVLLFGCSQPDSAPSTLTLVV